MTSRALAWRTLTANPARAVLAIAGVAVISALLFNMLLLSRGLLLSFRHLLDTTGYDVRVVANDSLPVFRTPITRATALVAEIARLPEVREVAGVRMDRAVARVAGRAPSVLTLISLTEGADERAWRIIRGQNLVAAPSPPEPPPLLVSTSLADAMSLAPGSTLTVRVVLPGEASAFPSVMFRVVGVADFGFEVADEPTAATTMDAFQRVDTRGARDEAEVVLITSRAEVGPAETVAAIKRLRPDLHVYSNEQLIAQLNENGFAYFRQISFVLSSITLGFAFLLVATLLTVSVNQRLSEVAVLRALGFPRRRIAANLLWESALLAGGGGLLALPLGGILAQQLDRILRAMPGLPEQLHFFVLEPRAVVLHVVLLAATGLGAAAYPIWLATRLPIAMTLRREIVS